MKLSELIKMSDAFTDETVTTQNAINYANKGIAAVNTRLGIALPFFTDTSTDYTALTPSWLLTLVGTYINYAVKLNDSSLNEADRYKAEFNDALSVFSGEYTKFVAEAYLNGQTGVYQIDTQEAIDWGIWTPRGGNL